MDLQTGMYDESKSFKVRVSILSIWVTQSETGEMNRYGWINGKELILFIR